MEKGEVGKDGLLLTMGVVGLTLGAGFLIGRWLKVLGVTSFLISSGTAICGGSAIAAVSPIVNASEKQMSVALGTIFILNSIALILFPYIGHWLSMSQEEFGIWCGLAIHDTSSSVGAAAAYGEKALEVATTVKLGRALWIIPLSIGTIIAVKNKGKSLKLPYFIGYFILAMFISTYFDQYQEVYMDIKWLAKRGLTLTLFLIGAGLTLDSVKSVGMRPIFQGSLLWVIISVASLAVILMD